MTTARVPPTRAVLYARVSSKDQEREGFSIPAQQKLLRQYARAHSLTIVSFRLPIPVYSCYAVAASISRESADGA